MPNVSSTLVRRGLAATFDYLLFLLSIRLLFVHTTTRVANGVWHFDLGCGGMSLFPLIWLLYFPAMEVWFRATFGKILFGIHVERSFGGHLTFIDALKRHTAGLLEIFCTAGLLAGGLIVFTPKHQRIGDVWADTVVVKDQPAR